MMICLILAAGYATRLYPLTENFPKPLLDVGGKPILDHLIDDLETKSHITKYVIISNHKFVEHFKIWIETRNEEMILVDDGSICNDDRLGAVRDIQLGIEKLSIDDDLLVLAGDNLLDFSLNLFIDFFKINGKISSVMRYFEENREKLKKTGVIEIDKYGIIIKMKEKPQEFFSNWAVPPFYIFNKNDIRNIKAAIDNGCKVDAPGHFLEYFTKLSRVNSFEMPGFRYDIGDLENYNCIKKIFKNNNNELIESEEVANGKVS